MTGSGASTYAGTLGGAVNLIQNGTGTLTLSADNSGISTAGAITLNKGTLAVDPAGSANALGGSNNNVILNSTNATTLNLGGTTQLLGSIYNTSAIAGVLTLTNGTLNITNQNNYPVFAGLNEASNASVQASYIFLGGVASGNSGPSNYISSVNVLAGSNSGQVYIGVSGQSFGSLELDNSNALGSALVVAGSGTLTSTTGFTNASATSIDLSGVQGLTNSGILDFGSASQVLYSGANSFTVNPSGSLVLTNVGGSIGGITNAGSGTLTLGGSFTDTGAVAVNAGTFNFNSGTINNSAVTVTNSTFNEGSNAVIAGSSSLTVQNNGIATINGTNTYTGATALNGGTTTLNGVLSNSAITVTNATFIEGGTGIIAGTTGLTIQNGSTVSLAGSNSYTGVTTVTNATVSFTGNNAYNGLTNLTINNGATAYFTNNGVTNGMSNAATLNSPTININTGGSLIVSNGAVLNMGNSTNVGDLSINGGTLTVGSSGVINNTATRAKFYINGGGLLTVASGGNYNQSTGTSDGVIGNSASDTTATVNRVTNAGTLQLQGLYIGTTSKGLNTLDNAGYFTNTGTLINIAQQATATGTNQVINYSGGVISNSAGFTIGTLGTGFNQVVNNAGGTLYNAGSLNIGSGASNDINLFTNGGNMSNSAPIYVGAGNGSTGTNELINSGTITNSTASFIIGGQPSAGLGGNGYNLVTNSGTFSNTSGTMTLVIGKAGTGTNQLAIGAGTFTALNQLQIGAGNTGVNLLTVSTNATLNLGNVTIGSSLGAYDAFTNAGAVTITGAMNIGNAAGTTATTNAYIQTNANSTFTIGNYQNYAINLGLNATASNVVNTLTLNAGQMTLGGNLRIGQDTANTSTGTNTVTLGGGTLVINGSYALVGASNSSTTNSFIWTGGTLSAATISATNDGWLSALSGSSISNNTLYNTNAGTLAVGAVGAAGKTTIQGSYTQSGNGTLAFDIQGNTQGAGYSNGVSSYDYLSISSNASFGGAVALTMNNYNPSTNATVLTNATFTNNTGSFSTASLTYSNAVAGVSGTFTSGVFTNYSFLNTNGLSTYQLKTTGTNITFGYYTATNNWIGGTNWGTGQGNPWNGGYSPNSTYAIAYFGTNTGSALNVTNDANVIVGGMTFSNSAGYTISSTGSSTITLDGSSFGNTATIQNQSGNQTINVPLQLNTLLLITNNVGSSTVTLGGSVSGTGSINATNGTLGLNTSSNQSIDVAISGGGNLVMSGTGTSTLSGANTYIGRTEITSGGTIALGAGGSLQSTNIYLGTLAQQGTFDVTAKGSSYTLGTTQTLSGSGNVNNGSGNTFTIAGGLSPGDKSTGTVGAISATGNVTLASTALSTIQLLGTNAGQFDKLNVTGTLTYGGTLNFNVSTNLFTPTIGNVFQIFTAGTYSSSTDFSQVALAGSWTGNFTQNGSTWSFLDTTNNLSWSFAEANGQLTVAAIPEPSDLVLFGGIVCGAVLFYRRRKARQHAE